MNEIKRIHFSTFAKVLKKILILLFFLVFLLSYAMFAFQKSLTSNHLSYIHAYNLPLLNEKYFVLKQGDDFNSRIRRNVADEIISSQNIDTINYYQITGVDDLTNMDFDILPGNLDLTYDGIALSKQMLKDSIELNQVFLSKDNSQPWLGFSSLHENYDDAYGKYLQHGDHYYKICIIYDFEMGDLKEILYTLEYNRDYFYSYYIRRIFALSNSEYFFNNSYTALNKIASRATQKDSYTVTFDDTTLVNDNLLYQSRASEAAIILGGDSMIADLDSDSNLSFSVQGENDIYISLSLYNRIFDSQYIPGNFVSDKICNPTCSRNILQYPQHINEEITLSIQDNQDSYYNYQDTYILKGVILQIQTLEVLVSPLRKQQIEAKSGYSLLMVDISSISDLPSLMRLVSQLDIDVKYTVTVWDLASPDSFSSPIRDVSLGIAIFLGLLLALRSYLSSRKKPKKIWKQQFIKSIHHSFFISLACLVFIRLFVTLYSNSILYTQIGLIQSVILGWFSPWDIVFFLIGLLILQVGPVLINYKKAI